MMSAIAKRPEPILWLDGSRGQYIPRDFAYSFANRAKNISGIDNSAWSILESGPDNEFYWDTWLGVLDNAIIIANTGLRYQMYQDGDCWLIPIGMEWDEKIEWFTWREEGETNEQQ